MSEPKNEKVENQEEGEAPSDIVVEDVRTDRSYWRIVQGLGLTEDHMNWSFDDLCGLFKAKSYRLQVIAYVKENEGALRLNHVLAVPAGMAQFLLAVMNKVHCLNFEDSICLDIRGFHLGDCDCELCHSEDYNWMEHFISCLNTPESRQRFCANAKLRDSLANVEKIVQSSSFAPEAEAENRSMPYPTVYVVSRAKPVIDEKKFEDLTMQDCVDYSVYKVGAPMVEVIKSLARLTQYERATIFSLIKNNFFQPILFAQSEDLEKYAKEAQIGRPVPMPSPTKDLFYQQIGSAEQSKFGFQLGINWESTPKTVIFNLHGDPNLTHVYKASRSFDAAFWATSTQDRFEFPCRVITNVVRPALGQLSRMECLRESLVDNGTRSVLSMRSVDPLRLRKDMPDVFTDVTSVSIPNPMYTTGLPGYVRASWLVSNDKVEISLDRIFSHQKIRQAQKLNSGFMEDYFSTFTTNQSAAARYLKRKDIPSPSHVVLANYLTIAAVGIWDVGFHNSIVSSSYPSCSYWVYAHAHLSFHFSRLTKSNVIYTDHSMAFVPMQYKIQARSKCYDCPPCLMGGKTSMTKGYVEKFEKSSEIAPISIQMGHFNVPLKQVSKLMRDKKAKSVLVPYEFLDANLELDNFRSLNPYDYVETNLGKKAPSDFGKYKYPPQIDPPNRSPYMVLLVEYPPPLSKTYMPTNYYLVDFLLPPPGLYRSSVAIYSELERDQMSKKDYGVALFRHIRWLQLIKTAHVCLNCNKMELLDYQLDYNAVFVDPYISSLFKIMDLKYQYESADKVLIKDQDDLESYYGFNKSDVDEKVYTEPDKVPPERPLPKTEYFRDAVDFSDVDFGDKPPDPDNSSSSSSGDSRDSHQ